MIASEYNCYKALHYINGENSTPSKKIYTTLKIIVDATKQRETTITNALISEYNPNSLCKISDPINIKTVVQKILPNNFDMANEDALFTFQTTLSNNYKYISDSRNNCNFIYLSNEVESKISADVLLSLNSQGDTPVQL